MSNKHKNKGQPNNQQDNIVNNSDLDKIKKQCDELKKQGENLSKQNEDLKRQNEELKKQGEELKKQNEELKKKGDNLTKDYQKIDSKYQEAKDTISNAKKIEQETLKHAEEMQKNAEEIRKNSEEMQEQINLATEELNNLENKIENAQKQSDEFKQENNKLRDENEEWKELNKDLQKENSSLQTDLKEAKETIQNAQENARQIRKEADDKASKIVNNAQEQAEERIKKARNKVDKLTKEAYEEADQLKKEAYEEAEEIKIEAINEAEEIRKKANEEADQLKKDAHDATMSTWKEQSDEWEKQRDEIRDLQLKLSNEKKEFQEYKHNEEVSIQQRKQELEKKFKEKERNLDEKHHQEELRFQQEQHDKKIEFEKEQEKSNQNIQKQQQDLDFQKEAIEEQKELIKKQKEKYDTASPDRLASLQEELESIKEQYNSLNQKYKEQGITLQNYQIYMDKIKTEMEDPERENGSNYTLNEIVRKLQEVTKENEQLREICNDYPQYEEIEALKKKADRVISLEREKESLEEECHSYQSELQANRNSQRELELLKKEIDANNTLNESLLQELNSMKSALENHTGDTCPSLSKVDVEAGKEDFLDDIEKRTNNQKLYSLSQIVTHVKNYAGYHNLYYTENDIRAFLAGMAVSRLMILQGMSGTGKSSLPRIFAEAISGFNRLIPVESSWRDRNELLGYYNDFNKKFNAKNFTIELYRSSKKACHNIPTFITLDEMNLARIEYYFSDFLAILQEPDPENWLIDLVPFDMRTLPMELSEKVKDRMKQEKPDFYAIWEELQKRREGNLKAKVSEEQEKQLSSYLAKLGELLGAKDLIEGRKIRVTENIWFIGTANKDESTFEITDKVYDRAQVISLNEKGKPETSLYKPSSPKYISVEKLISLFDDAKKQYSDEVKKEVERKLDELDACLMTYFDTSFGNRILNQTIDFATVFKNAGGTIADALDDQISTKILRKVITNDDENAFLELQKIVNNYPKTKKLIDKRIAELKR